METPIKTLSTLYEQDFYLWLNTTAKLLKERCFDELDLENLVEEIKSVGRSEKRELKSRLIILLEHLLKLKYWESEKVDNAKCWRNTIIEQKYQLKLILEDSPSFKQELPILFSDCYHNAREVFLQKSNLLEKTIPIESPFTVENVLDPKYLLIEE